LLTVKPSFIGLSCTTSSFLDGIRIAALARSFLPDIKIVFGGPHVSALKNRVLENFSVIDFVVVGEGEQTLRNGDEITSPTMHHSFRPPLPDLKSQKYQNSPLFHQLL